jgi:hypothetical protein
MQSGHIANSLAFIDYDLAIINTDHGLELVVNELRLRCLTFFVNRIRSSLQRDLLSLEQTELSCLVEWQVLLDAILTDDDSSLFRSSRERITGQLPGVQRL